MKNVVNVLLWHKNTVDLSPMVVIVDGLVRIRWLWESVMPSSVQSPRDLPIVVEVKYSFAQCKTQS